jgi:hypothetical protein
MSIPDEETTKTRTKKKTIIRLVPGLPVFREAFLAIYRSAFGWLERYFTIFSTI